MSFGVCIVAIGYPVYGNYAFNLALSLKVYDPKVKIAIIYSSEALSELNENEKKFFDHFIELPEEAYTIDGKREYMRAKLLVNDYTPFEHTIYLDADTIWLDKKISWLFGELYGKEFVIGMNGFYDVSRDRSSKTGYTYWCRTESECVKYHGIKEAMPQTVSGFFYFEKGPFSDLIFKTARSIFADKKAPYNNFAGGMPDEYAFNVALGLLNYKQEEFNPIYFDKLHGKIEGEEIYKNFFGIAIGGNRVTMRVQEIYNRLVRKYSVMGGIEMRHFYIDKHKIIPERLKS